MPAMDEHSGLSVDRMQRAYAMQRTVERHYSDLSETAADALGNVALVQSYARVELEVSLLRSLVDSLLRAQMPVLSWWAVANVLTRAGTTLTLPYDNMSLRDADDRPIDFRAFIRANILVTCDYGLPFGPDADWVVHACAASGDCAASTLRDHMMFYNSSPSSSQLMAGYEAALRNAAREGNWSFFHFSNVPNPTTALQYPGP